MKFILVSILIQFIIFDVHADKYADLLLQADKYLEQGKYARAAKATSDALAYYQSKKEETKILYCYEKLVQIYEASGEEAKAAEYRRLLDYAQLEKDKNRLEQEQEKKQEKLEALEKNTTTLQRKTNELQERQSMVMAESEKKEEYLKLSRDSLALMSLITSEREAQLLKAEQQSQIRDLKLREQDLLIEQQAKRTHYQRIGLGLALFMIVGAIVFSTVQFRNVQQKKRANLKIEAQLGLIQKQHEQIKDSIHYAQRIQDALLPSPSILKSLLPESFIFFRPRDVVSGDYYWFHLPGHNSSLSSGDILNAHNWNKLLITAADCTGHGVPGAFMSMIAINLLNGIAAENKEEPAEVLSMLDNQVRKALNQESTQNNDGMDMSLCLIDKTKGVLRIAGAKNPAIVIQDGELIQLKGAKHPIGGVQGGTERIYPTEEVVLKPNTSVYLFSDGYIDQFGGPENRKFMISRLKELLLQIHYLPMAEQEQRIAKAFDSWKGKERQLDDVLLLAFKV
jgi:serine phosphatase RsbU (regulator of sigma subunit)